MFDGEPFYLATDEKGSTLIVSVTGGPRPEFESQHVMRMVREAAAPNLAGMSLMNQYDSYYRDRNSRQPLPVVRVQLNDETHTRYYIDPRTARVVGNYSSRNWVNCWLYNGLHSFDFPWLYNHRPLWDIVVLTLMAGGTALCVTSLILAWRVIRRKLALLLSSSIRAHSGEDLISDLHVPESRSL